MNKMEEREKLSRKLDVHFRKFNKIDYIQLVEECKEYLDLRTNQISLEELNILIPQIVENIRIKILDLSQNHFSDEYGKIISRIVKNTDSIVELNLKLNDLEERGVQYIGQAIGYNNSIEILDMSWNHIRWLGAVSLCNGIKMNNCLNTLNVAYNGFGYEGAVALGEMLKHNTTLQNLDISSTRICWKGALVMSKCLCKNRCLICLKMALNPLTTTGAMDLLLAISTVGCAVEYFDIRGIQIMSEFKLLSLAIQRKRKFNCIHGDIVSYHDFLGRRDPLKLDSMSKVISYLKKHCIRPLELFRSFDKPLDWCMSPSLFMERLKKCDTELYQYEIRQVTNDIEHHKRSEELDGIRYRFTLVNSIADNKEVLRLRKQMELREERKKKLYHQRILKQNILIDDGHTTSSSMPPVMAMAKLNLGHGKAMKLTPIEQNNGTSKKRRKERRTCQKLCKVKKNTQNERK